MPLNAADLVWYLGLGLAGSTGAAGYFWHRFIHSPLAKTKGELRISGVKQPVEIVRDRLGIPHITAQNEDDLLFAQGFVHAQDRLWQMDYQRRLVSGRLSEVVGEMALPLDRWMRTLGMHHVADREVELLDEPTSRSLTAYARGVNHRIEQGRLPLEFSLLGYKPEPWRLEDSLYWPKMLAWNLSVNWAAELTRMRLIDKLGPELAAQLEPPWDKTLPTILAPTERLIQLADEAAEKDEAARHFAGPNAYDGVGSNNWAIAGSRTQSGKPIFANDMHLLIMIPSIWYENHLICGEYNAHGVIFPGLPLVIAGRNQHVAWGITSAFPDTQDLYLERLRREGDIVEAEYNGQWEPVEQRMERIEIKGKDPVEHEVLVTRHGPIVNDLVPDMTHDQAFALKWNALTPGTIVNSLYHINQSNSCEEMRQALRHWDSPPQNIVYADSQGNIGYTLAGTIPIRKKGDGRVPVPGWTDEYEWTGNIPFEELPYLYNPECGYIVTANNRVAPDEYPHWLGNSFDTSDRAYRIVELIDKVEKMDAEYSRRMQMDLNSYTARRVANHLGRLQTNDPELALLVQMMREWDGTLTKDSAAAALQQSFMRVMVPLLLEHRLEELTPEYSGVGPTPVLLERTLFQHRASEWIVWLLEEGSAEWFDLGNGEERDQVLLMALRLAALQLEALLGKDKSIWSWGDLHQLTLKHHLGVRWPIDRMMNRGPYPLGGDSDTICASGCNRYDYDCSSMVGPPNRFVVDFEEGQTIESVLMPGQSGQHKSKHYDDQVDDWLAGRYHRVKLERKREKTDKVLRLVPKS